VSDALGQGHAKKPENEGLKLHFSRGKILACKENVALAMRPWENAPLTAETVAKEGGFESLKALTDFGESLPDAPPEPTPAAKPVSKTATPPTGEAQSDEEEIAEIDDLCDSVAGRGVPLNDVIARKSLRTEEQADEHV